MRSSIQQAVKENSLSFIFPSVNVIECVDVVGDDFQTALFCFLCPLLLRFILLCFCELLHVHALRSSDALFWSAFPSASNHLPLVRTLKEARNNRQGGASNWSTESRGLFKRTLFRGGLIRKQQVLVSEGHHIPRGASWGSRGKMCQIVINKRDGSNYIC